MLLTACHDSSSRAAHVATIVMCKHQATHSSRAKRYRAEHVATAASGQHATNQINTALSGIKSSHRQAHDCSALLLLQLPCTHFQHIRAFYLQPARHAHTPQPCSPALLQDISCCHLQPTSLTTRGWATCAGVPTFSTHLTNFIPTYSHQQQLNGWLLCTQTSRPVELPTYSIATPASTAGAAAASSTCSTPTRLPPAADLAGLAAAAAAGAPSAAVTAAALAVRVGVHC